MKNVEANADNSAASASWVDQELMGGQFQDERLTKRFHYFTQTIMGKRGKANTTCLPGLVKYKSSVSFFFK